MTITVRLNFAKPPGLLGLFNVGNTQTMQTGGKEDHSLVINVDPSKHLNADGSFKKLDALIIDPKLSEQERNAFLMLKSADKVELLGHGAAGGDAIYSNPAQNIPTNNATSWYGETEYKAEYIGIFLADCDKGPDINVVSCHGASIENGQSICTKLRASLNKAALAQGKSTGAIKGYTRACGIESNGSVFLSLNSKEDRACSKPWWSRIPIIGAMLSFFANLWDALTGGGGPRKGTSEYNKARKEAERDSIVVDSNRVVTRKKELETAPTEKNKITFPAEKDTPRAIVKAVAGSMTPLNSETLKEMKQECGSDYQPLDMSPMSDTKTIQAQLQGLDILPISTQQESIHETVNEEATELTM